MEKSLYTRIKEELQKNPELSILKEELVCHQGVELDNTALFPFHRRIYVAPQKGLFTLPDLNAFRGRLLPAFPDEQRHSREFLEDDEDILLGFKSYSECMGEMTLKLTKEEGNYLPPFWINFKGSVILGDDLPERRIDLYMSMHVWIFPCASLGKDILSEASPVTDRFRIKKSILEHYKSQ